MTVSMLLVLTNIIWNCNLISSPCIAISCRFYISASPPSCNASEGLRYPLSVHAIQYQDDLYIQKSKILEKNCYLVRKSLKFHNMLFLTVFFRRMENSLKFELQHNNT